MCPGTGACITFAVLPTLLSWGGARVFNCCYRVVPVSSKTNEGSADGRFTPMFTHFPYRILLWRAALPAHPTHALPPSRFSELMDGDIGYVACSAAAPCDICLLTAATHAPSPSIIGCIRRPCDRIHGICRPCDHHQMHS